MLALVLGAVRARTAQALTVGILTALAAAVAVAGPWYGLSAAAHSAAADVAAAPAGQRVVSVRQIGDTNGQPRQALGALSATVRRELPIGNSDAVLGLSQAMLTRRGGADVTMTAIYRDQFCAHVHLEGACPATAGEAALSRVVAQQLGIALGQNVEIRSAPAVDPIKLRVVGRYDLADPTGAYWSDPLFRAGAELDPVYTPLDTFAGEQLRQPTLVYDVIVPDPQLRGDNGYDLSGVLARANGELSAAGLDLVDPTGTILQTIARDRAAIRLGVLVALSEVLVLAWFAIGLTGRYTGRDRRTDAALLKMRGNTATRILRLTSGQHLIPLIGGVIVGVPVGIAASLALSGARPVRAEVPAALALSAAAIGAVLLGGLIVLTVVDAVVLRLPVATLLRQVPARRRDWRADVVDLALLAVAAAAVYQARSSGPSSGLGLLAPALVAVAVALLLARLLGRVADRTGAVALRTGRLRFGLTAVRVSRQPGADRLFALVVVAVAMFGTAAGAFAAARTERYDRAEVELGADRVLSVQADTRTALEYAVRQADPSGRYAMAAVVDQAGTPPILAVDSSRLAAVARWRPAYGPVTTLPRAIRAVGVPAALPPVTGTALTVDVENLGKPPLALLAVLQNERTGAAVTVTYSPITPGRHTLSVPVAGCTTAPGCRFVRFEMNDTSGLAPGQPPVGGRMTIRGLAQQNPAATILDPARLTDLRRWYPDLAGAGLDLSGNAGGLTVAADDNDLAFPVRGADVYTVDAPLPLPLVTAGAMPAAWRLGDASTLAFGQGGTPARVAGTAGVLPVLGATGILVDLDATTRIAADADLRGDFQVWLAPDAPRSITGALTRAGLTITGQDSVAARANRLGQQGPAVVVRFGLLAAGIGVLLAAAAVAVTAAADRAPQLQQAGALRTQGLSRRIAVTAGWAGLAGLVVAGLLGGVIAALIARPVAGTVAPPFIDGWRVVAAPGPLGGSALLPAALAALVALGLTTWLAVRPLTRRLRGRADHGAGR